LEGDGNAKRMVENGKTCDEGKRVVRGEEDLKNNLHYWKSGCLPPFRNGEKWCPGATFESHQDRGKG